MAAEGIRMQLSSQRLSRGRALILFAMAALAVAVFGSGLASSSAEPVDRATPKTVFMRFNGQQLKFVGPDTIKSGANLRIVSKTNPQVVGPHTFSLVARSVLPKTRPARRGCFAPDHICRDIARWHGSNGNTPPTKNPAKAGQAGWDTLGNLVNRQGDSWFVGRRTARSPRRSLGRQRPTTVVLPLRDPSVHAGVDQGQPVARAPIRRG